MRFREVKAALKFAQLMSAELGFDLAVLTPGAAAASLYETMLSPTGVTIHPSVNLQDTAACNPKFSAGLPRSISASAAQVCTAMLHWA